MEATDASILVVDDDQDTANTTADLLRLAGYQVQTIYDSLQAVEATRWFHPHVVVLDINMPVMDGYEAAGVLRKESGPQVVLIARSPTADPPPDRRRSHPANGSGD